MTVFLDTFAQAFDALDTRELAGLGEGRRDALQAALRDGLPQVRNEAWKYTPLRALERRGFAPVDALPAGFDVAQLADIPAPRAVFVNGRFDAVLSDLSGLPAGVSAQPLSQALAAGDADAASSLSQRYGRVDEVFARLNAALATEGLVLRVVAGVQAATPVHLVNLGVADVPDRAWHLRHQVELGAGAALSLVEYQLAAAPHAHLSNTLTQIKVGDGARLQHARVQDDAMAATAIARTDAELGADADYTRLDLELGAGLSRHELNIFLSGDRAQLHANGVQLATGRRHLDTRLGVVHAGRDSGCQLTWRGLGAGRSRAAFHGGIVIREGADGTAATLSNKNLLLSADAEIDSQPVLEIHADEVQAAHGATVGQLDDTALFYLRSRGVPLDTARALLTAAFCRETLSVLDPALRASLTARLDAALARLEVA